MRFGHIALSFPIALTTALSAFVVTGCIDTQTPPEPTRQVQVPYGPRIYLKDGTIEEQGDRCRLLGVQVPTGTTAATSSITVDGSMVEDKSKAWNCYIEVAAGNVIADVTEVTNAQFQLCVDSDICKEPDPAEVDKVPVCSSESDFDRCPVVSVTQTEANRYCEFVGRRLPSGVESIVMRQPNQPQTPEAVLAFPTGNDAPDNCDKAVTSKCGKPQPITLTEDGVPTGGARLDKTTQGVFDLTGNTTEWTSDLIPTLRGDAEGLPWFCAASLPARQAGDPAPTCPSGEACIFGTYRPDTGLPIAVYPVCIADRNLIMANGTIGSAFGGNYSTSTEEESRIGTFVRSQRDNPNADSNLGDVGFRCIDAAGVVTRMAPVLTP